MCADDARKLECVATKRFLAIAIAGLSIAAVCLVLASVLNTPGLAVGGVLLIVGVLLTREAWTWGETGRRRALVIGVAVLALVLINVILITTA